MPGKLTSENRVFLATEPAGRREIRYALAALLVSVAIFCAAVPFATIQLAHAPAFIPAYQAALVPAARPPRITILAGTAAVLAIVCGLTLIATTNQDMLAVFILNNRFTQANSVAVSILCVLSLVALAALWWHRP